jgi:hypothetical protein
MHTASFPSSRGHVRTTALRSALAALGLLVVSASAAACAGEGDTSADSALEAGSGAVEAAAPQGRGAAGIPEHTRPRLIAKKIGNPAWEPADYHRFSADIGPGYSKLLDVGLSVLPPPDHQFHPAFGVGPGAPHDGPYDGEIGAGVAARGFVDHTVFTVEQATLPNGVMEAWMVVPSAGAPSGKTPDAASGPMIPNSLFPIHADFQGYLDGAAAPGDRVVFDVPPLDASLDPPFHVDGHSHFPIFLADDVGSLPGSTGEHEWRGQLVDTQGNGWELSTRFTLVE